MRMILHIRLAGIELLRAVYLFIYFSLFCELNIVDNIVVDAFCRLL